MIQMLMCHLSTTPECYLEKAKEMVMTTRKEGLKIGHVFYMLCHGRKNSQLSIFSADNIFFCQQESLVKVYNYKPGTVQKAVAIRAACSFCLLSNPLSKGQKEKGKR